LLSLAINSNIPPQLLGILIGERSSEYLGQLVNPVEVRLKAPKETQGADTKKGDKTQRRMENGWLFLFYNMRKWGHPAFGPSFLPVGGQFWCVTFGPLPIQNVSTLNLYNITTRACITDLRAIPNGEHQRVHCFASIRKRTY